jgi:hypothetical protein
VQQLLLCLLTSGVAENGAGLRQGAHAGEPVSESIAPQELRQVFGRATGRGFAQEAGLYGWHRGRGEQEQSG